MVLCLVIAIVCGGYLAYYYYTSSKTESQFDDLRDMIEDEVESKNENSKEDGMEHSIEMVTIDGVSVQKKFEKLYKENHDFIGWLTIEDTSHIFW